MEKAISKDATTTKPVTAISLTAARLSFASAATFLVLLTVLHFIKPNLDPAWHFISEYAIGDYGWIMSLAFLSLAFGCVTSFVTIGSQVQTIGGKIGLGFILVAGAALTTAAFFAIDPITATQDELTTHGNIHGLASMIGNPAFVVAALLVSLSLVRNPTWSPARRLILWAGNLPWISLVLMFAILGMTLSQVGAFGPEVPIGWPNRLVVATYSAWLMIVAWHVAQSKG